MFVTLARDLKSTPLPVTDDPRWARIVARDKLADGQFWYSVATTGVYCRPSCPSRQANPANVQLHDTLAQAKATGFRACRRCNPDGRSLEAGNAAMVADACRRIEQCEEEPSLAELADAAGRSAGYFHRIFKATTGLTPKDYAAAHRAARVRQGLADGASVTVAIYDAGFNSSGRFYERSGEQLGMTPGAYRRGGSGERIRFAVAHCWLGELLVAATDKGICAVTLGDDAERLVRELQDRFPKAELVGGEPAFERTLAQVLGAVEDPRRGVELPLDVRGTAFQQRVWQALREVPPGVTLSYSELAGRVGSPAAVRAVASACGSNEIALLIPCHRIVRLDGSPSGYRWGVERKKALLEKEATVRTA
jgi:AraC family transcriptional regulator of adaptative response/methylated-DNA-[protein]-cysteine methyltransferase